jgi:hypothetical protein
LATSVRQPARMAKRATEPSMESGSAEQLDLLAGAVSESERARAALTLANKKLRRSNTDLQQLQDATADGFAVLDEHTQGRLRELIEHAGDELAALVDLVLDSREAST